MNKYDWSDKVKAEVVEFVKRRGRPGLLMNTVDEANELLTKLDPPDPRPNFRQVDTCWCCKNFDNNSCDPPTPNGTCDNFGREKEACCNCVRVDSCKFSQHADDYCHEYKEHVK